MTLVIDIGGGQYRGILSRRVFDDEAKAQAREDELYRLARAYLGSSPNEREVENGIAGFHRAGTSPSQSPHTTSLPPELWKSPTLSTGSYDSGEYDNRLVQLEEWSIEAGFNDDAPAYEYERAIEFMRAALKAFDYAGYDLIAGPFQKRWEARQRERRDVIDITKVTTPVSPARHDSGQLLSDPAILGA